MPNLASIKPHNCHDYKVWRNTKDYNYITCYLCDNHLKFRYKSTLRQLKMLFWGRIK